MKSIQSEVGSVLIIAAEMMDMHTSRLVEALLQSGCAVTLVARENPYPGGGNNYNFYPYPDFHIPNWFRPIRFRPFLDIWIPALLLRRIWLRVKPDVVHNIYIGNGAICCTEGRLYPLVLTALGSDINDPFEKGSLEKKKKIAKALISANYVTADSQEVLKRCEILAGAPLNLRLFYFGIDMALFYPRSFDEIYSFRKKHGIPLFSRIILSPRRITQKMRHDVVIKAFNKVKNKNKNLVLILRRFGSYSKLIENEIRKLIEDLGIDNYVIWLDKIDYSEIPILYSLADVVINVPEQDGLPVTLLESSACMRPVVTTDLLSYQEFISNGSYCRVQVGDVEKVESAINEILMKSPDQLAKELINNYNLILRSADQKKCILELKEIYLEAYRSVAESKLL
jgi:glycosyltransferase involved in cell wall biosynthesis